MCYTKRITRGISAAFRQPIHFPIVICNFHFQSHHQWKYVEYRSGWKYCTECIGTKGILGISGVVLPNITHQQKWYSLRETNAKGRKYYISEIEKFPFLIVNGMAVFECIVVIVIPPSLVNFNWVTEEGFGVWGVGRWGINSLATFPTVISNSWQPE